MSVGGVNVLSFGKNVFKEFKDDDVSGLAAELTYRQFLALFPFLLFLAALGGLLASAFNVANPADRFIDLLGDQVPSDAKSVIRGQVEGVVNNRSFGLLSVGLIGALWAAGGGAAALIKALNRAYDIPDTRPFWKQKLLALGLVLLATVTIFATVGLLFATQFWGKDLAEKLGMGGAFDLALRVGAWPVLVAFLIGGVAFVYWAAPNIGLPFRWISPGAVFFAIAWALATVAFGFYVSNFSSYNATYGTLGGVVVLLLWFYITNVVLLLGAEINAVLDEEKNGPVLRERREKAAEAMSAKAHQQPRNPEAVAAQGTPVDRAARDIPANADGERGSSGERERTGPGRNGHRERRAIPIYSSEGQVAGELRQPRSRELSESSTSTATALMTLIGVIVAALAMRRYAR